jgi:hypothetical protein
MRHLPRLEFHQAQLPRQYSNFFEQAQTFVWIMVGGPFAQVLFTRNTDMLLDDNRQQLLAASFPQSVVSLLHRYSAVQVEPQTIPLPLMELKILKTTAGVILNTSLYFGPSAW